MRRGIALGQPPNTVNLTFLIGRHAGMSVMQTSLEVLFLAAVQVDHAIAEAIRQRKPVYISISCNLPGLPYATFDEVPVPFAISPKLSNPK